MLRRSIISWKFLLEQVISKINSLKKHSQKTPIPEFFYNKSTGPLSESLLKKKPRCRCIYVNFAKFLKAPFL